MPDRSNPGAGLRVLVVDDEANLRKTLSMCLEMEGHSVESAASPGEALAQAARLPFDVAFVDVRLGLESGLDLIPRLLAALPWLKIIVITAYASFETAVTAMRSGAYDYIAKPFTPAQVVHAVRKASEVRRLEQQVSALSDQVGSTHPEADFTSGNEAVRRVMALAREVAASEATVLIRGESGTGKTLLARAIHAWSHRAARPLGILSCPSLSPELLESDLFGHARGTFTGAVRDKPGRIAACEGGTLFLDEVGELPATVQPKLLRFLQDREYERLGDPVTRRADVRVIAATNRDLGAAVREGRFREDLYYRLNVVELTLPPLRERPEDIRDMAERMLAFFGRANRRTFAGFTPEALAALARHPWPGNLRELRNVVERAAILCHSEWVGPEHVPGGACRGDTLPAPGDHVPLARIEEVHIRRVISTTRSLQEAAAVLGIDQATLWRRRRLYGI